jgi:glutamate N-acetyltransferase/amino-acid N-acetyltransferase
MIRSSKTVSWVEADGGITAPCKFKAAAVCAGIKPQSQKLDLAILISEVPSIVAGVFTQNRVVAAPILVSRDQITQSHGRAQAVIVNSGNANACTGKSGLHAARQMAIQTSKALGILPTATLVASTGVIGQQFPLEKIITALPVLTQKLSREAAPEFAEAIMTTDTRRKICVLESHRYGRPVTIAGTAKGSGMIHPRLATMLAFLTTDVGISQSLLKAALRDAVAVSFNRITVDGDTSTNDSVFLFANGASEASRVSRQGKAFDHFQDGLTQVCVSLAKQIVRDGEGANRFIEIVVQGGRTAQEADRVARAIANSPLVKTALAGADANWGRIICAAGYSGASINPSSIDIRLSGVEVCRRGQACTFDEARVRALLQMPEIQVQMLLHRGRFSTTVWTCDLTENYIRINASYRS